MTAAPSTDPATGPTTDRATRSTTGPGGPVRRNRRYTPLDADGPLPADMVRAVPAIRRDPLAWLERTVERYGDMVAFPMPRSAVLLVNDPDGARQVLVEHARDFGKATIQYGALSAVTGEGLLTADGDTWRHRRRIAQPAFHHGALHAVADQASAAAAALRTRWDAAPGGVLDADEAALRTMLEVVGHTLFAADLGPVGERVVAAVDAALLAVILRARSPLPSSWPTPSAIRLRRAVHTLDEVCLDVVRRRRAAGVGDGDTDVLALLLRSAGPQGALSDRQVRDELVTLVIAGHETVASCLTWTLHLLAGHPDVQDRVAAELDDVLRGRGTPGAAWADLPALTYTRAVVDEALRLYPPAWVVTRRALADHDIAGVRVPAGSLVILSPWLLHRRAASWPDPQRFDPDRFLPGGAAAGASRGPARGDYVPFGAGPRLCIGRDMALVQATLILAGLLPGRRVLPAGPRGAGPVRVDALVTLRPRGGLPLRLAPG